MATSANIILNAFEQTLIMDLSGALDSMTLPTLDVSANAIIEVSLAEMRNVFQYHSDSLDVVNATETDLKFFVNSDDVDQGFAGPLLLNPVNAVVDNASPIIYDHPEETKKMVCHDFIRYLALKLFNTHHGVDLFTNEQEMLDDLRTLANNGTGHVWKAIIDVAADANDAAGLEYSTEDSNICCQVYRQMIQQFPNRFADINTDVVDGTVTDPADLKYYIPFAENDTLQFKLIITPAPGQEALTGVSSFGSRSYSITLLMKETPTEVEPVDDAGEYSFAV